MNDAKSHVPLSMLSLFQSSDKKELDSSSIDRDYPFLKVTGLDPDEEEDFRYYLYESEIEFVKQRMDLLGISIDKIKRDFEIGMKMETDQLIESRKNAVEIRKRIKVQYGDKRASPVKRLDLDTYNFEFWLASVKVVLENRYLYPRRRNTEIKSYIFNYNDDTFGFPSSTFDERYITRVALDVLEGDKVILDYTDLVYSEIYEPDDDLVLEAIGYDFHNIPVFDTILILTEGTSDTYFLSKCLNILYPHLTDRILFADLGAVNAAGGASQIVAFLKIFIAASFKSRVLALFDSDTAAKDALRALDGIKLPNNIGIMLLPSLDIFKSWPTIGPQGEDINVDINGKAVSLELFFPDKLLSGDKGLYPIHWRGYSSASRQYQGEIINKDNIQKSFRSIIESGEIDKSELGKIEELFTHIFEYARNTNY